jgi:membrane protease subunit HflC
MGQARTFAIVLLLVAAVIGSLSVYTVREWERAIVFQLGEIARVDVGPGLLFKIPLIQTVRKFDGRILTMDSQPERYLTAEKKNVIVDSFVKWRISDVGRFYRANQGDERRAEARLAQIIKDGLRSEFAKRTVQEVVSGERSQIMSILTVTASKAVEGLGMSIVDVRLKRIDLPTEVSTSVYRRMEAERARVAREFRSRGAEAAERIRADADRQRTVIRAEAYRDAERIRGEGDKRAAEIYAQAFSQNSEFYALYRSLNSYKTMFKDKSDLIVLEPDSEYFRYFMGTDAGAGTGARK